MQEVKNEDCYYLPIRSFGDFIITASIIKFNSIRKIPIILPDYHIELFNAIDGGRFFDIKDTISLTNQPALFEMYKVKDRENIKRLIIDMGTLYKKLNSSKHYLLDFRSRRLSYVKAKLSWPGTNQNMYASKCKLFEKHYSLSNLSPFPEIIMPSGKLNKVVIFPESRVKDKEIGSKLIHQIIESFDSKFIVARFSKQRSEENMITYSNFTELINIINEADLVISADSLPYHLANFYGKPHFVIYKKTKHFNKNFMTDFMMVNKCYSIIDSDDYSNVFLDL